MYGLFTEDNPKLNLNVIISDQGLLALSCKSIRSNKWVLSEIIVT